MSELQAKKGLKALSKLDELSSHRQKTASYYSNILKSLNVDPPFVPTGFTHSYLKYPLLVKNRKEFFEKAKKNKIELGDWFISPIHPIESNFNLWHYNYGSFPLAEKISRHIVNLPTHSGIGKRELIKIEKFLTENKANIYKNHEAIQ
jgi:dTDP-4-amino-4,6-dideoxygalactose transaminase